MSDFNEARGDDAETVEARLRAIWNSKGVPIARQDEMLKDICDKARVGAFVGPFQITPLR